VNAQSSRSILGRFIDATPPYSSPAHYAAMIGSTKLLRALRRHGADAALTALDHQSRTPLSYAVENLNESAVKFLVGQKHPKRGPLFGWCYPLFGKCISQSYLGSGHVWQDKKLKAAAIPSEPIKEALKGVGFSV
jgi:ankyrin repeat protein